MGGRMRSAEEEVIRNFTGNANRSNNFPTAKQMGQSKKRRLR